MFIRNIILAACCNIISFNTLAQSSILQPAKAGAVNISPLRLHRIDRLLKEQIDSGYINGAVGLVARNGKIVYHKALGIDDTDKKSLMKTDAIFRIASQTKAITSVAVMMLFEEGEIMLDDSIGKYIPAFANQQVIDQFNEKDTTYTTRPAKRAVTIRDLLTHSSGIDYPVIGSEKMKAIYAKAGIPLGVVSEPLLLADAMNKLGKLPLAHQPGERFTYGLSIDVLGYLVEVISKLSLDQFLYQHLFKPLGMADTYFYLPASKYARLVQVYTDDGNHRLKKWETTDFPYLNVNFPKAKGTYFSGGAGLSSTIMDYAIFLQMLLNGGQYNGQRILSRHSVELMTSNQIGDMQMDDPYGNKWGLGFKIITKTGQTKLGQSEGSFEWGGAYNTLYWVDPTEKLVCLLYTQQFPSFGKLNEKFKVAVYQALDD